MLGVGLPYHHLCAIIIIIIIIITLIVTKSDMGRVATIIRMEPRVRNIAQMPGPSVHAGDYND